MHPIKILIFIGSLTVGGAERVVVALSRYLVNQGYSVTVVTMNGMERDFYTLDDRVRRTCLGLAGENKGIVKITANIRRVMALRAVIKNEQPDVVLGMMTTEAILSILACLGLSTKVVVSERNYPDQKEVVTQWRILRKIIYGFADGHVAQTEKASQWLKEHTRSKTVVVIPNSIKWPIPSAKPVIDPSELLKADDKIILAVGSLSRQKGFDLLVEAFSGICSEHPDWKLVILGEQGDKNSEKHQRKKIERQVKESGLSGRVHIPGRVGNVGDWYQRANLFVLSSRYEGFPNVVLEAMVAGCPCIAFDCDTGPRDIIENGVNGILVPAGDIKALACEMETLMKDSEVRSILGSRAVQVRERFAEDRVLGMWENLIQELV